MTDEEHFQARKAEFWRWHLENPEVWECFERFALEAVQKGRTRLSHWLLINRVRWETFIVTTGRDYKISNEMIAWYARLWKAKHPQHADLFKTKRMRGEPLTSPGAS